MITAADKYTVRVDTGSGPREFTFSEVFTPKDDQETVFDDTKVSLECVHRLFCFCLFVLFFKCEVHVLPQIENSCKKSRGKYKANKSKEHKLQII